MFYVTVTVFCLQLVLEVQSLPSLASGQYTCSFSSKGMTRRDTPATLLSAADDDTGSVQVRCLTPAHNLLPAIGTGYGECDVSKQCGS